MPSDNEIACTTEKKVGLVYGTWAEAPGWRLDGASVECAACGRQFIYNPTRDHWGISVTHFKAKIRNRILNHSGRSSVTGLRVSVCPTCFERIA